MGKFRRDYLSAEEKNFYMISKAFIQTIDGQRNLNGRVTEEIWVEWDKRGMITPDMKKNLKMVHTYLKKFCYDLEQNLSAIELKRLNKQLIKFDYKLVDDYTMQKIFRDMKDRLKYITIERDKFIDVLEDIAQLRCVGCKEHYETCTIYRVLDDIMTPYLGEQPNCPYAADLSEVHGETKANINKLKAEIKRKNRFYKGDQDAKTTGTEE